MSSFAGVGVGGAAGRSPASAAAGVLIAALCLSSWASAAMETSAKQAWIVDMTLRYAHLGDRDIEDAAERVGQAIAELIGI